MIDHQTALAWAKDAGFGTYAMDALLCTARDLQALITRAVEQGRAEQADAIATLELENRMVRERNERLEAELAKPRPAVPVGFTGQSWIVSARRGLGGRFTGKQMNGFDIPLYTHPPAELVKQLFEALRSHQQQTRPIQQTIDALAAYETQQDKEKS